MALSSVPNADFIRPTTSFWQDLIPVGDPKGDLTPPFRYGYPAKLPDGRALLLPLRKLPDGTRAAASLIANQAAFSVVDALVDVMAPLASERGAEHIVGLPTLGLAFAPLIAQRLGHPNFIPMGYSRKFWYEDNLSEPVHSITSPDKTKRLFLDPNMLPRLAGLRVVIVDDAISSGSTILSAFTLLSKLDCEVVGIVVAMRQGLVWKSALEAKFPGSSDLVAGAISAPLFERVTDGWSPLKGSFEDTAKGSGAH